MKTNFFNGLRIVVLLIVFSSCDGILDKQSDEKLSIPRTLEDFQALLDNFGSLNTVYAAAGEVGADDYYLTDEDYETLFYESDKRLYTWQPDYVTRDVASGGNEWYYCYRAVYICNAVLVGLENENISGNFKEHLIGQALFHRAARYLDALQIWAPAYNEATADQDLGIVLREDPDMNVPSARATVNQCYQKVLDDLTTAVNYLPESPIGITRPSRAAAYSLLARAHLFMGNFEDALECAQKVISKKPDLTDFNTLSDLEVYPIKESNVETIFWAAMFTAATLNAAICKIDSDLYASYAENDLRKRIYFDQNKDGTIYFRGNLTGASGRFTGPSVGEMYLIQAECQARLGLEEDALTTLNYLLEYRWTTGSFTHFQDIHGEELLNLVLKERRKELVMRGLRWPDIKRLNVRSPSISLSKKVNGVPYSLKPNDLRFAVAIPEDVISISGISQNPR